MPRTFAVASDAALVALIERARKRLVVIAPALTQAVADALAARFADLDALAVTVILDTDPEVYRLGFGDLAALDTIRTASASSLFDLREQPGVRIGVVISDDTTMVYSPVPKTIEAGSTSAEKPNAIVLSTDDPTTQLAVAAGAEPAPDLFATLGDPEPEVGQTALAPEKLAAMQADLDDNPPRPFDLTRRLNVFISKVQYVEFSVQNYRITKKQVPLPPDLVGVEDDDLKSRISGHIRAPFDGIGKIDLSMERGGKTVTVEVNDDWLDTERKRIEKKFTFPTKGYGRVILRQHRLAFDAETAQLQEILQQYHEAVKGAVDGVKATFEKRVVDEYFPRWKAKPPYGLFAHWEREPSDQAIREELASLAADIFKTATELSPPVVKVIYRDISADNLHDEEFLKDLRATMKRRRVPQTIIDTLFETGVAAPESGSFHYSSRNEPERV